MWWNWWASYISNIFNYPEWYIAGPILRASTGGLEKIPLMRPCIGHHENMIDLIELIKSDPNLASAIGGLASAIGGLASAIVAFLALIVSGISVYISVRAMKLQRKHNELSVRPLAEVTVADYENSLRVKLRNNGTGPMIITSIDVLGGAKPEKCLKDCMPKELPNSRLWTDFSGDLRDRSLQPGSEIVLLELTEYDDEKDFGTCREVVRAVLAPLTVIVSYTDIYENPMETRKKSLSWFGRYKC